MAKPKPKRKRGVIIRRPARKPRNIEPAWESPPDVDVCSAIDALKAMQASFAANPTGHFDPASLDPIIASLTKAGK